MTSLHKAPVTEVSTLARLFKCVLPMLFSALPVLENGLDLGLGWSPSLSVVAVVKSFIQVKFITKSFFLSLRKAQCKLNAFRETDEL